jgi:hypothetical protein
MKTFWSEYPDASTERGWLKALTPPFDYARHLEYTHDTMPVYDDGVPGHWREQSTLGNYLDYGPVRPHATGPQVHCICYANNAHCYVETVAAAKAWIEERALQARPELFEVTA